MSETPLYDAVCAAVAELLKDARANFDGYDMASVAVIAKNYEPAQDLAEIRLRATRELGKMIVELESRMDQPKVEE
jgi:hypothetical protein